MVRSLPERAGFPVRRTVPSLLAWFVTAAAAAAATVGISGSAFAARKVSPPLSPSPPLSYLTLDAARRDADTRITRAQLKDYLTFIASDELQGRDTPSNGLNTAALFLATELDRWGLKPAGDNGTFFQKIALLKVRQDNDRSSATLAGTPLHFGEDFLLTTASARGADAEVARPAPLVYVSHGWVVPNRGIDAYKGVDVRGKILVVDGRGLPEGVRYGDLRSADFADAESPQQYGAAHGALGIVIVGESEAAYDDRKGPALAGHTDIRPAEPLGGGLPQAAPKLPAIIVSPIVVRRLFAGERLSADQAMDDSETGAASPAFDFSADKTMAFAARYAMQTVFTQNVVAIWEGSDPKLRSEYVALGAHYDHLGVSATPDQYGNTIYNGADDDGSGTTALLGMAEAFSHSPVRPKRSLLFVWHCGEEKGLWGSAYFTQHPTVPLKSIIAQLNIDMIGRSRFPGDRNPANAQLSGPHEVYVIGSRMLSPQLGDLEQKINSGYLKLKLNYRFDDPNDPERLYYRSDHYNYARHGIPIIFFFDGIHEDYHRRTDKVAKIDFEKMTEVVRTVFLTATAVADLPHPPAIRAAVTQR